MPKHIAIETPLGTLNGRDCIYLDLVQFEDGLRKLILSGEINGSLCARPQPGEFIRYTLTFQGVLATKIIELDSWDWESKSSFDEVLESQWIRALGGKITDAKRHFLVQTYDDVFDIVCDTYEFKILANDDNPMSQRS